MDRVDVDRDESEGTESNRDEANRDEADRGESVWDSAAALPRSAMLGPVTLDDAIAHLEAGGRAFAAAHADPAESAPLLRAVGRVLAHDLAARADHPNVDDSALDGIACRAGDVTGASTATPVRLRIVGASAAGRPFAGTLAAGQAVRIQTGAAVPTGADAIVPVEDLREQGGAAWIMAPAAQGAVRPRGQNVRRGQVALRRGDRLDAARIALAATMGHDTVPVRPRVRVALLVTGDELVTPGGTLAPGQVFDGNGSALVALVRAAGAEAIPLPRVADDLEALATVVAEAPPHDLLISSGGISMGRHDHVRDHLQAYGVPVFRKVLLKPGGPATFAHVAGRPWLALPGNPVSVLVTFLVLARCWIDPAHGSNELPPLAQRLPARAGATLRAAGAKTTLLRVALATEAGRLIARIAGNQSSAVVRTLAEASALAIVPPHAVIEEGDAVEVVRLAPHLG